MGVRSADQDRYTAYYRQYVNSVYKTALIYSDNQHTAQEIVQEVFTKFYFYCGNIREQAIGKWLKTTTMRMALNYKRDHGREIPAEEIYQDAYEALRTESLELEYLEKLYYSECQVLVDKILDGLFCENERWYEAVTATYILKKPQKEVAEAMGMSIQGFESMLYRARKWIQKNYQDEYERVMSR